MDNRDAKRKRPITCLESGVTYDSAYRAAKELGFADSRNIFRSIQRGTCTQGLHFYYADEPKPAPEFFIPPNRAPRPVVCLDTGEAFESAFQAGRAFGITPGGVRTSASTGVKRGGLHFYYGDEPKPAPEFFRERHSKTRPIVCLETGETFVGNPAAARPLHVSPAAISQAVRDGTPIDGLHFYHGDEPKPAPEFFKPAIDLEELAGEIASKVDGAGLTPVIEKEIVHYEIIRSLGRNGLLRDITFQGGTSLRLCYGSQRYSEDLDFVAGDRFDSLPLDDFSRTLRCDLLRSYDTEVSVREPKVVNDLDGVGMRRWTVSVNTNIARPDLPKQRIKLEIASVPAHTSTVRRVAVNYPELAGMYDDLTIRCQTLEEILADKLISFSATDTHIRHRDLWDIPWIVRAQEIDFSAVAALVAAKHDDYRCPVPLARMIAVGMQRAHVCYADGSFTGQMQRFLSPAVLDRTHDFDNHCDALNAIVERCYGRVAASLGISDQVERARRRLATEISSGSISATGMPKRNLGLS